MFQQIKPFLTSKLRKNRLSFKYLSVVIVCLILTIEAKAQLNFPDELKSVGTAELKVLWFDIYQAELKTYDGDFNDINQPLALILNYQRRISAEDLIEETKKQLGRFASPSETDRWVRALALMWTDVNDGDQLAFYVDENTAGHFFYNRGWIGEIDDPNFCQAFINIWLSESSRYPQLAKKLRGE
ncbi:MULTISPECIES: chalcone isomerase family protein [unclassified Neptuniibacter]|uniref:chalcone isomerase family protein n=1 Tax=unclassified Neptuniibacter TaxID=2630693 RepID=UPI0025D025BF|nr:MULTISPECIES: chalcone isomerase family protein [unclassified Neptuniibacter]|tara:strand:+ start:613 stop:1167 length:555 start_codon:yes stop_codon:yes gene_type:complete